MLKYNKSYLLVLLLVVSITCLSSCSSQLKDIQSDLPIIEYYYFNTCGDCDPEGDFIKNFEEIVGVPLDESHFEIIMKNVYYPSSVEPFNERMLELNLDYTIDDVPIVIVDDNAIKAKSDKEALTSTELIDSVINNNEPSVILFTSPGCKECIKVKELFVDERLFDNLNIVEYSISDSESITLSRAYIREYKVSEEEQLTPILYVGDRYYSSYTDIKNNINEILSFDENTPILQADEEPTEELSISNIAVSFIVGLLNGFNPCSISMTIMLLSILIARGKSIKATGLAYASGKFIGFLLLGTILFNVITLINYSLLSNISKIFLIVISVVLAIMNLIDAINIRKNKLGKIRLQLPEGVRRFNHRLIEKYGANTSTLMSIVIGFLLGIVISAGEFLCTGQLYLATIVTLANSNNGLLAYIQLALYSLGFVSVLIVIVFAADRGMNSFKLSSFFAEKMFAIKIANMIFFVIMLFVAILFL